MTPLATRNTATTTDTPPTARAAVAAPARLVTLDGIASVLALGAIVAAAGCTDSAAKDAPVTMGDLAPAVYAGTIACADCPGIELALELRVDGLYLLRTARIGDADGPRVQLGRWGVEPDSKQVTLRSGAEPVVRFAVEDRNRLRKLDDHGRGRGADAGGTITRTSHGAPSEDVIVLRGHYFYMADAAIFTECGSGKRFDVTPSTAAAELERRYAQAAAGSGDSVVVSVAARITAGPNPDTAAPRDAIDVERVEAMHPGEDCEPGSRRVTLLGTRWELVEVAGEALSIPQGASAPHLSLERAGAKATGFTGCNQFSGSYTRVLDSLTFGPLASTRKACKGLMETESAFMEALDESTRFRIQGDRLVLRHGEDVLATFVAASP